MQEYHSFLSSSISTISCFFSIWARDYLSIQLDSFINFMFTTGTGTVRVLVWLAQSGA